MGKAIHLCSLPHNRHHPTELWMLLKAYGFTLPLCLLSSNYTNSPCFWLWAKTYNLVPENLEHSQLCLNRRGPPLCWLSLLHMPHWSSLLERSRSLCGTMAKSISDEITSLGLSKQLFALLLNNCVNRKSWLAIWNECDFTWTLPSPPDPNQGRIIRILAASISYGIDHPRTIKTLEESCLSGDITVQ